MKTIKTMNKQTEKFNYIITKGSDFVRVQAYDKNTGERIKNIIEERKMFTSTKGEYFMLEKKRCYLELKEVKQYSKNDFKTEKKVVKPKYETFEIENINELNGIFNGRLNKILLLKVLNFITKDKEEKLIIKENGLVFGVKYISFNRFLLKVKTNGEYKLFLLKINMSKLLKSNEYKYIDKLLTNNIFVAKELQNMSKNDIISILGKSNSSRVTWINYHKKELINR